MKAILTSALGGYIKTADGRIPDTLLEANGLLDTLHFLWKFLSLSSFQVKAKSLQAVLNPLHQYCSSFCSEAF